MARKARLDYSAKQHPLIVALFGEIRNASGECRHMAPEGHAYLAKHGKCHVTFTPLDTTDVRPIDLSLSSEDRLRPT